MSSDGLSQWQTLTIEDVADVIGGGTPSTRVPENFDGEIPWITPKDLSQHEAREIFRGERNITDAGLASSSARILPKGTVLLSTRAPIGYVAIAAQPVATNQGFRSLVMKGGNVPEFFYYLLKANKPALESRAGGSTFREISGTSLKATAFAVPAPGEQRRIAWVLGTLDDKIESNRRLAKTLEEIASALFKARFVDFVGHDDLVTSEIGPIPRGWEVGTVGDLCVQLRNGATPRRMEPAYWEGGTINWFKTGELAGGFLPRRSSLRITERGLKESSCTLFPRGTVLVAIYAAPTVGRLGILDSEGACNQACTALGAKDSVGFPFLYFALDALRDHFNSHASGSAQQNISKKIVESAPVVVPPDKALREFDRVARPLLERVAACSREVDTLERARELLLPRLTGGRARVAPSDEGASEVA